MNFTLHINGIVSSVLIERGIGRADRGGVTITGSDPRALNAVAVEVDRIVNPVEHAVRAICDARYHRRRHPSPTDREVLAEFLRTHPANHPLCRRINEVFPAPPAVPRGYPPAPSDAPGEPVATDPDP